MTEVLRRPHSVVVHLNDEELAWIEACAGYLTRRGQPTSIEGMLRIAVAEWSPPVEVSYPAAAARAPAQPFYKCACPTCPGYPYKASEMAHPCHSGFAEDAKRKQP